MQGLHFCLNECDMISCCGSYIVHYGLGYYYDDFVPDLLSGHHDNRSLFTALKYRCKNSEGSKVDFLDTLSVVIFIVLLTRHVINLVYYACTCLATCWTELSTRGKTVRLSTFCLRISMDWHVIQRDGLF
jgi:hypothetical protein